MHLTNHAYFHHREQHHIIQNTPIGSPIPVKKMALAPISHLYLWIVQGRVATFGKNIKGHWSDFSKLFSTLYKGSSYAHFPLYFNKPHFSSVVYQELRAKYFDTQMSGNVVQVGQILTSGQGNCLFLCKISLISVQHGRISHYCFIYLLFFF